MHQVLPNPDVLQIDLQLCMKEVQGSYSYIHRCTSPEHFLNFIAIALIEIMK